MTGDSTVVRTRGGADAFLQGKGFLGRVLVGKDVTGRVICWNLDGRYRWDGVDDPRDIVECD